MASTRKSQISAPAGGAGLIRYFDVDEGGPKMDPKMFVGVTIAVVVLEVLAALLL